MAALKVILLLLSISHVWAQNFTGKMAATDKAAVEKVRAAMKEGGAFPIVACNLRRFLCDNSGRVVKVLLPTMDLGGRIAPEIGNLTNLKILHLYDNRGLEGSIPNSIGKLKYLQELKIYGNKFSGIIPNSIGQLKFLKEIDAHFNQVSGKLPDSIGQMTSLQLLDISYNQLSGKIPDSIGQLKSLKYLYLNGNKLGGNIPNSIGLLTSLLHAQLSFNQLSGGIPKSIVQMKSIQNFDISHNYFVGPIIKGNGHPNCKELRSNCLFNSSLPSRCTTKGQRSKSVCTAFCSATQAGGPCGGFGICSIGTDGKTFKCTCDKGYNNAKNKYTCMANPRRKSQSP